MIDERLRTGGALDALPDRVRDIVASLQGRSLSGYRIGGPIGVGGMGYVLHATRADGDFDRPAAIKIVPTNLGTSEPARRFMTEVRILAKLNHPSIAQLYDAGETEEGWPYLVMELVDGLPVDRFCVENGLDTAARVQLIIEVARAVHFAHVRLIVHRDLKPSNVLVDASGRAKLLDFGIAKLLEPDNADLTVGLRPMTPSYASPEQLLDAEITTLSDIYQLGMLMLAVIAEEKPAPCESVQAAIRRAATGQDQTISARAERLLSSDLLAIVTRCLHADPEDRYPDVTALIDDLLRYQQGYPVEARRGSTFYRLRKLVRRNVPATAFASLALAIAIGGITTYTHDMNDARRLAEDRALTASQTLSALSGLIADTYSELIETRASRAPGQSPDPQLQNEPLRLLLERTERLIDNVMTEEPALEAELQLVQAVTNLQLGRTKQTRKQLESALDLVQQTGNANGEAAVLSEFIALESVEGNSDGARERVRQAFEVMRNHDVRPSIQAGILINAVHVESDLAQYERAIEYAQRAIGILETRHSTKQLARAYVELGTVYGHLEQSEPARRWMRRAVELYTEIEGPSFRGLIPAYSGLAYSHAIAGEYEPALEYFRRELEVARANYGEHHIRTAMGLNNIGIALRRMGRYEEAIDSYLRAEDIMLSLPNTHPQHLGNIYINLGNSYRDAGDMAAAAETYERGLAVHDQLLPRQRAFLLNNSGQLFLIQGNAVASRERLELARAAKKDVFGADNVSTARTTLLLARANLMLGELDEVPNLIQEAEQVYIDTYGRDHSKLSFLEFVSGEYARATGDLEAARDTLLSAYGRRLQEYRPDQIETLEVALTLARTETAANNLAAAREWLARADPGVRQLERTRKERIEYEIIRAELLAAEGRAPEARTARDEITTILQTAFPARSDWQQRLAGI